MSQPGPTAYRVLLGRELKNLRDQAGVNRETVATHLGWDLSKVSRLENGQITLKAAEVDALLELFGAADEIAEEIREAGRHARKRGSYGKVPDWSRQYFGLEQDASSLKLYMNELVPGIFQTEDYARALLSTSVTIAPADLDKVIEARMRRQALLNRDNPPTFHLILGETVLHQEVGGKAVLQAQLTRLITLAKQPNITIQVMPFSAGQHPAQGTTFTLLTVGIGAEPTTWACIETLTKLDCQPEPGHVRVYELVFDRVAINALGERESLTRIRQARDALN